MANMNCIVIDDDDVSRLVISKFIERTDYLDLSGTFDNAIDASNLLVSKQKDSIDLVFLDIEMPEMTGFDLVKALEFDQPIIYITSQERYALEAFDGNTVDYLVKPPKYARFLKAVEKAKDQFEHDLNSLDTEDYIFIKSESRYVRIPFEELLFVEAQADYVTFHTDDGKYVVHHTMKGIEKRLPIKFFSRVHRSYIVNRRKIDQIEDIHVVIGENKIPIGALYKANFLDKLNIL